MCGRQQSTCGYNDNVQITDLSDLKNDHDVNLEKYHFDTLMIPVFKAQSVQLGHYCQGLLI